MRPWLLLCPAVLLATASPAQAGPAAIPAPPASAPPDHAADRPAPGWYGWQIAITDVAGAGLLALGVHVAINYQCDCEEFGSGYLMMFGASAYLGGGPAFHRHHRRHGPMVLSAALRVGLPVAGWLIARDRGASRGWTATAAAGGAVTAMVVDWSLLSHDHRRVDASPVAAYVTPVTGGATAGLTGRF